MSVSREWQIQIVLDGMRGTHGSQPPREQAPPKGRGDLDVTQCRGMEVDLGRLQDGFNPGSAVRLQEVFDQR
jgi:hypothetical protein